MPNPISHVTLNTGHTALVPHSFLTDHPPLAKMFKTLVQSGGGAVPTAPHIAIDIVPQPNVAATLSLSAHSTPCVVGTLCYDPKFSAQWWQHLWGTFRKMADVGLAFPHPLSIALADALSDAPQTPWLGVVLLNSMISLDPEDCGLLAAVEENIAIAFLELQKR
jgi:hypothetical protein